MEKKTAATLLENYITPAELKFEYLPGEKLLVDSFLSKTGTYMNYVVFLTNKRIILRQPDWVDVDAARFADMRFINWSDVESIVFGLGSANRKSLFSKEFFTTGNFFLSGKVIDFSPEKESDNYFYGTIGHKELFANLSYSSEKEFRDVFFPALNKMSKEYDFPLLVRESEKGYTQYSNDKNNDAIKAYEKCVSSVFN